MQLFKLSFNAHAHSIITQKMLLRKSWETFATEIMKMLRKFQCWAKKKLSHEMTCVGKKSVAIEMEAFNL